MFRRWPFFQRLLSWTKPYAPVERDSRAYERYDWNSLLADEPDAPRDHAGPHGRVVVLPVAAGDGAEPRDVRRADGDADPLRLPLDATRREDGPDGERFVLETTDGEYRARVASSRSASPSRTRRRRPASSSSPTTPTRARPRPTPAGASSSSASRTPASSSRPGCCRGRAGSSSPRRRRRSCRSTRSRSSASGPATSSRSRTTSSAAACPILDASIGGIERGDEGCDALVVRRPAVRRAATSSRSRSTR